MVDRNAKALADQLLALPPTDRARLAQLLLASLEESEADVTEEWGEEIERRAEELSTGQVRAIPIAEVLDEVERRLKR